MFIKMSNEIFRFQLSPKALLVYAFLCHKAGSIGTVSLSAGTIAAQCGLCRQTVLSALQELESASFLTKCRRIGPMGYRSSLLHVKSIVGSKGWFPIPCAVFNTHISPSDFLVYCFLLRHMDARSQEAFPSLSRIAANTGLSRRRVAQAIAYLRQYTFINRVKRHKKRTRAWRHNRYLHFACNGAQKKEVRSTTRTSQQNTQVNRLPKSILIIAPKTKKNKFFCNFRW